MPPPVTTGMLTAIPELLPRLIVIVLNHTEASRAITRAGTDWICDLFIQIQKCFETLVFGGCLAGGVEFLLNLRQTLLELFVLLGRATEVPDLFEEAGCCAAGF